MKKIITLTSFLICLALYLYLPHYTNNTSSEYNMSQFIIYSIIWSGVIFALSLLAFRLNNKQYKIWSFVTILYFVISLTIACLIGNGSDSILVIDGKLVTYFLSGFYCFVSTIYFTIFFVKNKSVERTN